MCLLMLELNLLVMKENSMPNKPRTIIERDIEFYQGCVEDIVSKLRQCYPDEEHIYSQELEFYQEVASSLIRLQDYLNRRG